MENGNHRTWDTREMRRSLIEEQRTLLEEDGAVTIVLMSREVEVLNFWLGHVHIG